MRCPGWLCRIGFVLAFVAMSYAAQVAAQPRVVVYPQSAAIEPSADFVLAVRVPGGTWQQVPVYGAPVSTGIDIDADLHAGATLPLGRSRSVLTSLAMVDFSGEIEIEVRCLRTTPRNVRIRPANSRISARIEGNAVRFTLDRPQNLSIEIDGDIFHNLQLFAGAIPEQRLPSGASNEVYFAPGVHLIGTLNLQSGTNVYLAGGAVVVGGFSVAHAHDVKIEGHGILISPRLVQPGVLKSNSPEIHPNAGTEGKRHDAVLVEFSRNVKVAGITVISAGYTVLTGQSENVEIRDMKSFSAGGNNDGIDVFSSQHVVIDGVFMRNSDDTIALYGHRWNYYGDLTDVTVENSTLWADVAHPILVGTHGNPDRPEVLSRLYFKNIDILDHREPQIDYQGCMSLNAGDANLIKDVLFEDIRVDDFRMGQLLNLRVMFNRKYNTAAGRGIENVVFRNLSYNGTRASTSIIAGYDGEKTVSHIRFEGLKINGVTITDTMKGKPGFYKTGDIAHIFIGEHANDVTFVAGQ